MSAQLSDKFPFNESPINHFRVQSSRLFIIKYMDVRNILTADYSLDELHLVGDALSRGAGGDP